MSMEYPQDTSLESASSDRPAGPLMTQQPSMDGQPWSGNYVLGRYHLLRRLGQGGMSEVYLARDKRTHRHVAVKIVGTHVGEYLERFRREARTINRLKHVHILSALGFGSRPPWYYLVMPYYERGTLLSLLEQGPLTPEHAGELLVQIASALQYAHDRGIIHRDIKPSNILLRDDHYTFLADFGLAKELEGSKTLTQTGILMGTPEYMAPDLADGAATISTDIYSLGVLLYQMVVGYVPFSAETPIAVYFKQIREQPLPPSYHNPTLSPSIDSVILRALEKDPRRRFRSVQALADSYMLALADPEYYELAEMPIITGAEQIAFELDAMSQSTNNAGKRARQVWRPQALRHAQTPQPQKIILRGDPDTSAASPAAFSAQAKRVRQFKVTLPPLPMRLRTAAGPFTPSPLANVEPLTPSFTPPSAPARSGRQRSKHTVATVLCLGIVFFLILPITLIYCAYNLNQGQVAPISSTNGQATTRAQGSATAAFTTTTGTLVLSDPLARNVNSRWAEDLTGCVFQAGAYHVNVLQQVGSLQACPLIMPPIAMNNMAVQVDVMLNSGYEAGMLLRDNGPQYYLFALNNQGQFSFRRHNADGTFSELATNSSNGVLSGSIQNTLLVIAHNDTFQLYINSVAVGTVHDSTYADGSFALAATSSSTVTSTSASFSNFKVFALAG